MLIYKPPKFKTSNSISFFFRDGRSMMPKKKKCMIRV